MGFRVRKSIKLAPGVRMTASKTGLGYSVGTKGYRVTKRADGRTQRTASLPGTGLMHVTSGSGSGRQTSGSAAPVRETRRAKPGLLAPKAEKRLHAAVMSQDVPGIERVMQEHSSYAVAAAWSAALLHLAAGRRERGEQLVTWVFDSGAEIADDTFVSAYLPTPFPLEVVPGLTAELELERSTVGLLLAELRQNRGDLYGAIDVVEQLEPTVFTALSLVELYGQIGRYEDVIDVTNGVSNEDDATALLCAFRGVAFRERGRFDASRESLKEALKSKKREPVIRHRAWFERSQTYLAEGKRSMAKKDLERILAEDADYDGLATALAELG